MVGLVAATITELVLNRHPSFVPKNRGYPEKPAQPLTILSMYIYV